MTLKNISYLFVLSFLALAGCAERPKAADSSVLLVSIQPLKYLVDNIVGEDFHVEVLTPPGTSPETYEPTPAQIKAAEAADLVFSTGLIDFERALLRRLPSKERFVDLSEGIELIEGTCSHDHSLKHGHGVDPHTWMSPRALLVMAGTAYSRIHELYPDSVSYTANYIGLKEELELLDSEVAAKIGLSSRRAFVIFHPGLTYYARDYGLRQIALEHEGKEPSARQLQQVVDEAKSENITRVFYQSEFPRYVVEVAATEIGAQPVEIDILGCDVVGNILKITDLIIAE